MLLSNANVAHLHPTLPAVSTAKYSAYAFGIDACPTGYVMPDEANCLAAAKAAATLAGLPVDDALWSDDWSTGPPARSCSYQRGNGKVRYNTNTAASNNGWYQLVCVRDVPETVTCEYTIDNYVSEVRYNGKVISSKPRKWNHWPSVKTISFTDEGPSALLEIDGKNAEGRGCQTGGLGLKCVSTKTAFDGSVWDGFTSDNKNWQAAGSNTEGVFNEVGGVCKSTSGFSLRSSYPGIYTKIWPSNGLKYALFQGNPYGGRGSVYCVYELAPVPVPKIQNVGGDCWGQAECKQKVCDFCGTEGRCCRPDGRWGATGCPATFELSDSFAGPLHDGHRCWAPETPVVA